MDNVNNYGAFLIEADKGDNKNQRYAQLNRIAEYTRRICRAQEIDGDSVALRIGSRIRVIRKALGLSQAELGERIGLTADRIQKYENGARKPNPEQLQEIADGLGVNYKILVDPIISEPAGAIFALFEMEVFYNLKVGHRDGKIFLSFDDCPSAQMNEYLKEWDRIYSSYIDEYNNATSEVEAQMLSEAYERWKYSFLGKPAEGVSKKSEEKRLEEQIEVLQRRLKNLQEE